MKHLRHDDGKTVLAAGGSPSGPTPGRALRAVVTEPRRVVHLGPVSRVHVPAAGDAEIEAWGDALRAHRFVAVAGRDGALRWVRPADLLNDDWPMQVALRRVGDGCEIDVGMVIPWAWIAGLAFVVMVILPFVGLPGATLAWWPGLAVVAGALALRRFDCRPDARFWQQRARRRWHETLSGLLTQAFG